MTKMLNSTEINQLNPSSDVLHALNVTKRGCEELLPENDWLRKLIKSE
ncbi:MAG: tyrosine--tRNA ligase, partial [Brachymonas denitrificans]